MNTPFVGVGQNPDGRDLPLGLGMQLAQHPDAMDAFGNLTQPERDSVVDYIQGCETSAGARERIAEVIQGLMAGQTSWIANVR